MIQTIKKHWSLLLLIAALIIATVVVLNKRQEDRIRLSVKTFAVGSDGWGYDVLTNDSVFIHQQYIPAIQGNKSFISKEQAEKTGNLVLLKLKRRQPPAISLQELDSCHIQY